MRPRRGLALAAVAAAVLLLALALATALLMQPQRLARLVLGSIGDGLGLEIGFEGEARYRLRGTPMLEVRDVAVRRAGADGDSGDAGAVSGDGDGDSDAGGEPLLRAARVQVSLPWSTVRGRGASPLVLERIELDAPELDFPQLQGWLSTRPPGDGALPTLDDGLRVRDGRVLGEGWELRDLDLHLPRLEAEARLAATVRGVLVPASQARLRFDLQLAATRPAVGAGIAVRGPVQLEHDDWRLPAFVAASGAPRQDGADWRLPRLRFGTSGAFHGEGQPVPFALGIQGPLRLRDGNWTLAPAGVVLRGDGIVPSLAMHGHATLGRALAVGLEGAMPRWPGGWPALPPPLDDSRLPTAVDIRYAGPADLSAPLALRIARGDARAEASAHVFEVLDWMDAATAGTPLPPLRATASVPRVEVAGGVVEGLEIELDPGDAP